MHIKEWLIRKNMTPSQLAVQVGCSRQTISKIIRQNKAEQKITDKILQLTDGQVVVDICKRGRPRIKDFSNMGVA